MDKYAPDDIPNITSTCFKLNSLQLQALLRSYHCAPDEPFIPAVGAPAARGRSGSARGPHALRGRLCRPCVSGVRTPQRFISQGLNSG